MYSSCGKSAHPPRLPWLCALDTLPLRPPRAPLSPDSKQEESEVASEPGTVCCKERASAGCLLFGGKDRYEGGFRTLLCFLPALPVKRAKMLAATILSVPKEDGDCRSSSEVESMGPGNISPISNKAKNCRKIHQDRQRCVYRCMIDYSWFKFNMWARRSAVQ